MLAGVASFVLAASTGIGAATADTGDESDIPPGLTDSSDLPGQPFVSGVAKGKDKAAKENSVVLLRAWPNNRALEKLEVGESVKMNPVGVAHVKKDGTFEMRISNRPSLRDYENEDGTVDFELVSFGEDGLAVRHFVADPDSVAADANDRKTVTVDAVVDVAPRFIDEQEPVDKACTTVKSADLGPAWVSVGYGYATSGATMKFTYTSGASSELGAGVSTSGKAGTFSASGTASYSSSGTVDYPSTGSFKVWKTQFRYGKYLTVCQTNGIYTNSYYTARVDGYVGGSSIQTVTGYPTATYCTPFAAGSTFTKNSTTAYTSSVGAATSGFLGINVSAKTGYTSTASLKFSFSSAKKLCGTNDYPGGSPRRLVSP